MCLLSIRPFLRLFTRLAIVALGTQLGNRRKARIHWLKGRVSYPLGTQRRRVTEPMRGSRRIATSQLRYIRSARARSAFLTLPIPLTLAAWVGIPAKRG